MTELQKGRKIMASRRRKILRKSPAWIVALVFLLVVYTVVSFYLTIRSGDLHEGTPGDWKLGPERIQKNMRADAKPPQPFGPRPVNDPEQLNKETWLNADEPTRNLSTDTLESSATKFGFVMRDFARRVLSRHISSSNVLVVASDAVSAAKEAIRAKSLNKTFNNIYDNVDFESPYSLGGTFLLHAAAEGHDIHAIDFEVNSSGDSFDWQGNMDTWWNAFGHQKNDTTIGMKRWSSTTLQPKWIIAAIFDHFAPEQLNLTDSLWSSADAFLKASTITYVVVRMHSRKINNQYEFGGLVAARALLDHRYKLQTLLLSHFHAEPGKVNWTEETYGPNAIYKTRDDVEKLLRWGADQTNRQGTHKEVFTAYIFATQGLDLAIPSSRVFIDDSSRVIGTESTLQINLYKPLQFKQCPQAKVEPKLDIAFSEIIGDTSVQVTIPLGDGNQQIRHYHPHANEETGFTYQYTKPNQHFLGPRPEEVEMWFSNSDMNQAEAACARLSNFTTCTTRVIDRSATIPTPFFAEENEQTSIFLIMIDPISRPHFHRSMPRTSKVLEELGFLEFGNYTAIGPNSGKNQAALYSGMPLADRNGIKKDAGKGKWLWDRLRENGFITLKAENGMQ
jgi:Protein of unknown function (DUF229)